MNCSSVRMAVAPVPVVLLLSAAGLSELVLFEMLLRNIAMPRRVPVVVPLVVVLVIVVCFCQLS